jgi:glycosyltransferase involved in cell wall biosynthesis
MTSKVGVLTSIPSPYQVELFDAIARRGRIDLKVWYCAERDTRRLWEQPRPVHASRIGAGWRITTGREHWYLDPRPAAQLVRWKPDLAVFSVYSMPAVQLGMWWATQAKVPWVYWGEAVASGGSGLLRRTARNLALLPVRRWACGLFGVGTKGTQNLRDTIGADRPILNMPYFSNLARFTPADGFRVQPDETRFLFVGSFIYRKGVDVLARAFSALVESVPGARLVVAGDGDATELFDDHLSPAAAERVIRCGFVPWTSLPELYRRGDFLVMPSRYDGWGLVIPEAMASGLPVIGSTAAGATLDLVREGMTGWRVGPGDPVALADTMRRAASLPSEQLVAMRRRCAIQARRYDATVGARVFERAVRLVSKARGQDA